MIAWLKASESSFKIFCSLNFNDLYFLNVNKELSQSMENQFALIDEDIDFVLEKFLAVFGYKSWVPFLSP